MEEIKWWMIVLYAIAALIQSSILFIDARKKNKYPWFWGIWALTHIPMPSLFYLLFVVWPHRKKQKKHFGGN